MSLAQKLLSRGRRTLRQALLPRGGRCRQQVLATVLGLWVGCFTLWHYRQAMEQQVSSGYGRTSVHEMIDRWHLDDEGGELPLLNPMRDSR